MMPAPRDDLARFKIGPCRKGVRELSIGSFCGHFNTKIWLGWLIEVHLIYRYSTDTL